MVIPLWDDNSDRRTTPFVNYALIAINVLVFVFLQNLGRNEDFTYKFSTVPEEILYNTDLVGQIKVPTGKEDSTEEEGPPVYVEHRETPVSVYLTLLTSMFMHGGIAHIIGNMLFLWIFGDNLEDFLGHFRYALFYLICGLLASLAHVFTCYALGRDLNIPSLGASGAISGVLGGYILLFPSRRVTVLLFRFISEIPAWVALGIWFVFQLISGIGLLGGEQGGVAYGAHIGGFVAGLALVKLFSIGKDTYTWPGPVVRRGRR
jgi:membrane associated rhomboid family serine protease